MRSTIFTVAFALTVLGATGMACTAAEPASQAESQAVTERGALGWDAPVEGELRQDLEYHAYTFEVKAGSRFTLEITQKGSSMGLDTMMLLYGPADGEGQRERLAVDYDSGWGGLSKLEGMTVEHSGMYVVTVGTASGLDRGRYRLALTCDAGNCIPEDSPLPLIEGEPNTEFLETFNAYDSEYCYQQGRAFHYSDDILDAGLTQAAVGVMNIYREELELYDDEIEYGGEISLGQFDSWLQETSGLDRGTFEGAVGIMSDDEYRVGEVLYEYGCAPSVTCSATIMVALIPSWNEVWTVEFGCGDE